MSGALIKSARLFLTASLYSSPRYDSLMSIKLLKKTFKRLLILALIGGAAWAAYIVADRLMLARAIKEDLLIVRNEALSETLRSQAMTRIAQLHSDEILPVVEEWIGSPSLVLQTVSIRTLGIVQTSKAKETLLKLVGRDLSAQLQEEILFAARQFSYKDFDAPPMSKLPKPLQIKWFALFAKKLSSAESREGWINKIYSLTSVAGFDRESQLSFLEELFRLNANDERLQSLVRKWILDGKVDPLVKARALEIVAIKVQPADMSLWELAFQSANNDFKAAAIHTLGQFCPKNWKTKMESLIENKQTAPAIKEAAQLKLKWMAEQRRCSG